MTDVSVGPSAGEARIQSAADEAYRVLARDEPAPADATARFLETLRARTRERLQRRLGVMLRRRR